MPITLPQLLSEITNDPAGLGYAGKTDSQIVEILNRTIGAGTGSIYRDNLSVREIVAAIAPADFQNLTAVQCAKLQLIFTLGGIDATISTNRTIFLGIFSGMTTTIQNLTVLASRTGSRAEVLGGIGTYVTEAMINQARGG